MPTFDDLFVLVPLGGLSAIVAANLWRFRQEKVFSLHPNCLITRYPLIFVSGIKSPFYFLKFWNQIPSYLYQHGYIVEEWSPSGKGQERISWLREKVQSSPSPLHLIFDGHDSHLGNVLSSEFQHKIASITFVGANSKNDNLPQGSFELNISQASNSFSLSKLCSKLFLLAHSLWVKQKPAAQEYGLGLPGFAGEAQYHSFLSHAVKIAESDFLR